MAPEYPLPIAQNDPAQQAIVSRRQLLIGASAAVALAFISGCTTTESSSENPEESTSADPNVTPTPSPTPKASPSASPTPDAPPSFLTPDKNKIASAEPKDLADANQSNAQAYLFDEQARESQAAAQQAAAQANKSAWADPSKLVTFVAPISAVGGGIFTIVKWINSIDTDKKTKREQQRKDHEAKLETQRTQLTTELGAAIDGLESTDEAAKTKSSLDLLAFTDAHHGYQPRIAFVTTSLLQARVEAAPDAAVVRPDEYYQNLIKAFCITVAGARKPAIERRKELLKEQDEAHADDVDQVLSAEGINLEGATLYDEDFSHLNLDGASFRSTRVGYVRFDLASLRDANFTDAALPGSFFAGTVFDGTNFTGANLDKARFSDVDFSNIDILCASSLKNTHIINPIGLSEAVIATLTERGALVEGAAPLPAN